MTPVPETADILDIYDSEVDKIHAVHRVLSSRAEGRVDRDAFDREIHERFHEIGFTVSTLWYHAADDRGAVDGLVMPEITINGRIDAAHEFDYDRQVHEVTHDLLGIGDGGVINTGGPLPQSQREALADHARANRSHGH